MNPENEKIARKLDELGQTLISQGSLAEDVMQRIRSRASSRLDLPAKGNLSLIYILKPALTLAACLMLVTGIWLALYAKTQPAFYSQIKAAIDNSDHFYQVTENISDGQELTLCKLWYDRKEGLIHQSWQNGKKISEIVDDGKNRWFRYPDGNSMQLKSIREPGKMDFILTLIERFSRNIDRSPLGDQKIDGDFCECYVLYNPDYSPNTRYYLWIDAENRIRMCEIRKFKDLKWQLCQRNIIEYDINLDPSLFDANSKPGTNRPMEQTMASKNKQDNSLASGTGFPHDYFLHSIRPQRLYIKIYT